MATVLKAKYCERCGSRFVPKSAKQRYCKKNCPKPPEFKLVDESNHLLSIGTSAMSCGIIETSEGPRLLFTVRTSSSTVTVGLNEQEAEDWASELRKAADALKAAQPE